MKSSGRSIARKKKQGFEWLVDEIMRRRKENPRMHVYHFGAYEPSALKRLMGMYATREDEIDSLLRAGAFVDLHQVFKQGLRASVEEYSLKGLEAFYAFERQTPLEVSRTAMRYVEHRLELGWEGEELPDFVREAMEGYNGEDCFSTLALRDWLEEERRKLVEAGNDLPRFTDRDEQASDELDERQKRVAALVAKLTEAIPADASTWSNEQHGQWLLAQFLDWHRRENKATYWEGYRLAELDDEDLLEERAGIAGLKFLKRLSAGAKTPVDRYSFEKQETEARCEKDLYYKTERFGCIVEVNLLDRSVDVKKTRKSADLHPTAVYLWERPFEVKEHAEALYRIGTWVAKNGIDDPGAFRAGRDLLLRKSPRLRGETLNPLASETPINTASRIAMALDDSAFAIQGPPGSGKTYTGARMICELVQQGKKIGVTALSHKVIRNLLDEVVEAAREKNYRNVFCLHRDSEGEESDGVAVARKNNDEALDALRSARANVVGGTSWLWSPESAFEAVDVMFIDEAGQMSLADVLAVSQGARNLVLLGDPQQLERPLKGSHPDGAEKSALEHLLNGRKTISPELGYLLPESWRLHPAICKFTSEVFYEDKLGSHAIARNRVLDGHPWLNGAGLWFVPVTHDGSRNSCPEEVDAIDKIVEGLLQPDVAWFRSLGNSRRLEARRHFDCGAVQRAGRRLERAAAGDEELERWINFRGRQAAVVIYSLTTSSPEDAPRGMEFLYSLNRLNVATSRAMSTVIIVGSPRLLEPECKSPRQMQLANALCRYRELSDNGLRLLSEPSRAMSHS